jgi:hypothetical protein
MIYRSNAAMIVGISELVEEHPHYYQKTRKGKIKLLIFFHLSLFGLLF